MDAKQIRSLNPLLRKYLARFDDCFQRSDTRGHLWSYVSGQLSDLPRKNCEPSADAQGILPRTLQQFLSLLDWDHHLMKTKLQQLVAAEHASEHGIGIIDETACPKKGEKTPGVQRQRYYKTARTASAMIVGGRLQIHETVVHVLVSKIEDMTERWRGELQKSRDFR